MVWQRMDKKFGSARFGNANVGYALASGGVDPVHATNMKGTHGHHEDLCLAIRSNEKLKF